ncbi:hypothetical protein EBU99_10000 [bacterium]|nr:hypothetical protein [bacterium]
MPILLVPPTQVVPFDSDRLVQHRKQMEDFRAQVIALWNPQQKEEVKTGAFRGARTYEWSGSQDALLQTYFVYPSETSERRGEVARMALLFRKENCQLLGSTLIWGSDWSKDLPQGIPSRELVSLKDASGRTFQPAKSPIRLSIDAHGYWSHAMAWISEAWLGEKLAAQGLVVQSDLSGLACFRDTGTTNRPAEGARGHRQLKIVLEGKRPKQPSRWPLMEGRFAVVSLPLNGKRQEQKFKLEAQAAYQPEVIAEQSSTVLSAALHNLEEKKIRVSQRKGLFATVDRGIAFGLKIGMHVNGPDGAQLHVIRFEKSTDQEDAAILLIRKDSKSKPLAEGALLEIDATQFPKK